MRILAGVLSIFRSIRFRLLFLFIITVAALFYQVAFVTTTINTTNDYKRIGQGYLQNDTQVLNDITRIGEIILSVNQGQIDHFIYEMVNGTNLDQTKNMVDAEDYTTIMADLSNLLTYRDTKGYELQASSAVQFTSDLLGTGNLNIGGYTGNQTIIDNSHTSALRIYSQLNTTSVNSDGRLQLPIIINSLNLARSDVNFRASNVIDLESPTSGNLTNFIRDHPTQGQQVEALYHIIQERLNLASYNSSTILSNAYSQIYGNLTLYLRQLINYGNEIAVTELDNIDLSTLQTQNSQVKTKLALEFQNMETVRTQIIEPIITQSNFTDTKLQTYAKFFKQFYQAFYNQIYSQLTYVGVDLPYLSYYTNLEITQLRDKVQTESQVFTQQYDDVLNTIDQNLNLVQLSALILIVLVVFISALTSYQLISSFGRFQKGYSQIAVGDLQIETKSKYKKNELGDMDRGFDNMVNEIRRILSTIQRSSERMAGISEELAAGSEEASASVTDVANTVREFSSGASEQNLLLNRVEIKLDDHLKAIEEAAQRINQTSTFVLKVAKRTNILGLNASIEAAKAGRFGLGFDVVAEEVRNLSDETKKSALEIADLIESIETRIQNTVREISHEVSITKDVAENTAAGSEEASASTSEQVVMLNEISQTSNELSTLASELAEIVNQFKV